MILAHKKVGLTSFAAEVPWSGECWTPDVLVSFPPGLPLRIQTMETHFGPDCNLSPLSSVHGSKPRTTIGSVVEMIIIQSLSISIRLQQETDATLVISGGKLELVEHDKLSLPTELDGDEEWVGASHRRLHVFVLGVLQAVHPTAVLDKRHTLNHVLQFRLS